MCSASSSIIHKTLTYCASSSPANASPTTPNMASGRTPPSRAAAALPEKRAVRTAGRSTQGR